MFRFRKAAAGVAVLSHRHHPADRHPQPTPFQLALGFLVHLAHQFHVFGL